MIEKMQQRRKGRNKSKEERMEITNRKRKKREEGKRRKGKQIHNNNNLNQAISEQKNMSLIFNTNFPIQIILREAMTLNSHTQEAQKQNGQVTPSTRLRLSC